MAIVVQTVSTSTSVAYSSVFNWVAPDVPMAPIALVQQRIMDSIIELCERALIWRQEIQQINVLPSTSTTATNGQNQGDQLCYVASATGFQIGSYAVILLIDGTHWRGQCTSVDYINNILYLNGQLNQAVNPGATVLLLTYLYPMTMPSGTAFAKGLQAWLNNNPIDPISQDDLDNEFNNTNFSWVGVNWRTDVNLPSRFYFPDDTTVGILMSPTCGGFLRVNCALKPLHSSTSLPAWIYERYIETIGHGALAKLMVVPHVPYSNPPLAQWHREMFNSLIGEARIRAARAGSRAPLRVHTVYRLR